MVGTGGPPAWGRATELKAGGQKVSPAHPAPGFWGQWASVPVQVCLDFTSWIFKSALNMLAFKVIYTWQNMAFRLEGKKGRKGILDTK